MFNFFWKRPKAELFYKTDVHCHILPGVDHGAKSIDHSIELIDAQMEMGINRMIFTPHITKSTFENTPDTIKSAYNVFCDATKEAFNDLKHTASAEYRLDELSLNQFANDNFIPMPGNHILIENAYQQERIDLDEIIFNLQMKDFTPIMAHPERFLYYVNNRQRFNQLHNAGALFQINIMSFTGYFGRRAKSNAEWLLENNLIDFLGSDIHNMEHVDTIRNFRKTNGYRKIAKKLENKLLNDSLKF